MPRNTREENKRRLKAASNLCDNIESHLMTTWSTFPDEPRYEKYKEALINAGQLVKITKETIDNIEENL